jgi:hypothetical protein
MVTIDDVVTRWSEAELQGDAGALDDLLHASHLLDIGRLGSVPGSVRSFGRT